MGLFVCRHGRTEANASGLLLGRADPDLDPLGRAQADALASSIAPPARVISSPLARCRQTAAAFGSSVEIDERLVELDYGEYDLTPLRDVPNDVWRQWRLDPDFRPPGGETLVELAERVSEVLDELAGPAVEGDIVLVSHVSPIKAALAWTLGVPIAISWRCFVAPASLMEVGFGPAGPSLRSFNSVAHLSKVEGQSPS